MLEVAGTPDDFPVGVTGKVLKRRSGERYADITAYIASSEGRILAASDRSPARRSPTAEEHA